MTGIKNLKELDSRFFGNTGEVHFYSICDVIDYVMPNYWGTNPKHTRDSYEEMQETVKKFQKSHDMHFYSAPRENFSLLNAQNETLKLNLTSCIIEDLS